MSGIPPRLTPIHLKDAGVEPPREQAPVAYVLARNGLFLQRNHRFFRSCVRAATWPAELERQEAYLEPLWPKLSRRRFERIVGFFAAVAATHRSEAGVLLVWNDAARRVEVLVPPQVATLERTWNGSLHPIGLRYEADPVLPEGHLLLGDVHCHVDAPAFASGVDVHDEMHRPGLHLVIGRIGDEPPDVHVEAVVDRQRFSLQPQDVVGGYRRRNPDVPAEWLAQVSVEVQSWSQAGWRTTENGWGHQRLPDRHDAEGAEPGELPDRSTGGGPW